MGSSGQKPRKPEQHHLPKVGSKANVDYEVSRKREEAFRGWPVVLVAVFVVLMIIAVVVLVTI